MKQIDIYWEDLTVEKQKELIDRFGDNCEHVILFPIEADDGIAQVNESIDTDNYEFKRLHSHLGHRVECVGYGQDEIINMSIECLDCNEVLYSVDKY